MPEITKEYIERLTTEYLNAKSLSDKALARTEELKRELSTIVDAEGYTDNNGHRWYEVQPGLQLKRERRVSVSLNQNEARRWAESKNLWADVSVTVEVLDEDLLADMAYEHPELAVDITGLYSEKEIWAFKVIDDNK